MKVKIILALLALFSVQPAIATSIDNFTLTMEFGNLTWSMAPDQGQVQPFVPTIYDLGTVNANLLGGIALYDLWFKVDTDQTEELQANFEGFAIDPQIPVPDACVQSGSNTWSDCFVANFPVEYAAGYPFTNVFSIDANGDFVWNPGIYGALTIVDPPAATAEMGTFGYILLGLAAIFFVVLANQRFWDVVEPRKK